ncbi:ABC transporter permease [Agrobacterium sp. NPDC089420]|uniref:ABC transporter permease n=1 Tax=Agrobacterium sp. NPDC089420 TaxID=3363918 RepID=UPI00384F74FA
MTVRRVGTSQEIIREVVEHLDVLKGKGLLALVGIVIGTVAVIAMLHVGHNARRAALSQFETLGTNLVMMQPQPNGDSVMSQVSVDDVLDLPRQNIGLSATSAMIQTGGNIRAGRTDVQATVVAGTDGIYGLGKARLALGRFTSDLDGAIPFAVLGFDVSADITRSSGVPVKIGDRVTFGSQVLTVIGILQDTPSNFILNIEFNRVHRGENPSQLYSRRYSLVHAILEIIDCRSDRGRTLPAPAGKKRTGR